MNEGAAQTWFIVGTIPLMLAGGLHAIYSLVDTVRPTYFTPIDRSVKAVVDRTGIRLIGKDKPSMWTTWLGFNISHGLGVFTVGLLCLLIAAHDFKLFEDIAAIRPLTIAFSVTYLVLSLRFWFYLPAIVCCVALTCFTVATVLSA